MRMQSAVLTVFVVASTWAIVPTRQLSAQGKPMVADTSKKADSAATAAGPVTTGIEVGFNQPTRSLTPQQRGKFLDYRDVPMSVPYINQFLLRYTPVDSLGGVQLSGRSIGALDQSIALRASKAGLYDFNIKWDRIPHTYSTDARSLGAFNEQGVYTLPAIRPDSFAWRAAPYIAPVRTIWDPVKVGFAFTPTPEWDFKAEYNYIGKYGYRPIGMAFGGSSNTTRELLEPINQTQQGFAVSQSYARPKVQLSATYDISYFHNALLSVTSDNPQQGTDTPTAGSSRGRTSLAPSNMSQAAGVTAGVNLPLRTRIVANGNFSWSRQDETLLPQTINSVYASDPRAAIPRTNADAHSTTTLFSVSANSRPWTNVTLSAKARTFDYGNTTAPFAIANLIVSDRSVATGEENSQLPFKKDNADFSAMYRIAEPLTVTVGLAWEHWKRDSVDRNVKNTDEHTPRVAVEYLANDWLSLRASYLSGKRRGSPYLQNATSENPESRRFDEADRDRTRSALMTTLSPSDKWAFTVTWEVGSDEYLSSVVGLQSDKSAMVGVDLDYTPSPRFVANIGYTNEKFYDRIAERYRSGSTAATLQNPTWLWVSNNTDFAGTTYASFRVSVIPGRLDAGGTASAAVSNFHVNTTNPVTPSGGTAAQNLSATAVDWPIVTQEIRPASLFARYFATDDWALTLRYSVESYKQNDFRVNDLSTSRGNHIFLGNYFQNYDAGWLTLLVSWHPASMPFARVRSAL